MGDNKISAASYKSMFEQAVLALAEIDSALGIPDDGCNDPQVTVSAIKDLLAGRRNTHLQGEAVPVACIHPDTLAMLQSDRRADRAACSRWSDIKEMDGYVPLFLHPQPAELNEVSGNSGELNGEYAGDTLNTLRILLGHMCDSSIFQPPNDYNLGFDAGCRMVREQSALAATGKQQAGEMKGDALHISDEDRAVLQRIQDALPTVGLNGWAKGVEVLERLLRDSLASRQPVGDEDRAEIFRKGWEAGNAAQGIDLEQLVRLRNDLHAMSKHGVKDGWQDAAIELVADVTKLLDGRDAGTGVG